MTTEEKEGNRLIAIFMEWAKTGDNEFQIPNAYPANMGIEGYGWTTGSSEWMNFHNSFDWLMPVVEKICKLKIGDGVKYVSHANPTTFGMINEGTGDFMVRLNGFGLYQSHSFIEAIFEAVVDFVKWYNEHKQEQP